MGRISLPIRGLMFMEDTNIFNTLTEKFPFLTYGTYLEKDYIGVVQNADNQFVSLYVYNRMHDEEVKKQFLAFGDEWWWGSNRMIPINIFFKDRFRPYREFLQTFAAKDFEFVCGPIVSLDDHITKRIKRRSIQLIRNCD